MKEFTFSELNRNSGDILDRAMGEPVALAKHGRRKVVMVPAETWDRLAKLDDGHQAFWLDEAPQEDIDNLMTGFQEIIDEAERAE
jgi:prevent-host-death family protein